MTCTRKISKTQKTSRKLIYPKCLPNLPNLSVSKWHQTDRLVLLGINSDVNHRGCTTVPLSDVELMRSLIKITKPTKQKCFHKNIKKYFLNSWNQTFKIHQKDDEKFFFFTFHLSKRSDLSETSWDRFGFLRCLDFMDFSFPIKNISHYLTKMSQR